MIGLSPSQLEARVREVLAGVPDPEIPVLSVVDLGILRFVRTGPDDAIEVGLTPTYSGCPATEVIRASVLEALRAAGFANPRTVEVLAPPWSSDWISEDGRRKLRDYGIAPPPHSVDNLRHVLGAPLAVACPRCASLQTERLSEFGSTPCKALHRCRACGEPFDCFKCI